jgi:membrane-bound lytic murein transglycosylase D
LNFEQIAAILNMPVPEIRQLNPQYKRDIIPAKSDKPFVLKLPLDKISPFIDSQTRIFAYNRDKYFPNNQIVLIKDDRGSSRHFNIEGKKKIYYTVVQGDNPGAIAGRYKVSVNNLVDWNNIRHNKIKIGQQLAIYVTDKSTGTKGKTTAPNTTIVQEPAPAKTIAGVQPLQSAIAVSSLNGEYTYYTVRRGDSLYTIAKQFAGVSDAEIKLLNNIKNAKSLVIGQILKIPIKA